ncbi:MAG: extracellular solute-binding protein [Clostridia bacterium]|nr:extracellular solute-binding protein [Clostridia bacterium]
MKMKKIICASVALIMAVGMLAGCGNGSHSEAAENFSESNETLTIKWLGYPKNPGAEAGGLAETAIEEKFNVEIEPIFYEENKFNDKKTMLMAGGEIPDLVYEMDPSNVFQDVDQDFIVEVPYETIEKYAPEYFNYLNEYAPAAWLYSRYDDANWGLPNFNHSHTVSYNTIWRKDWLDKFGLDVPVTIDDFHEAFDKFTHGDPDGNGKDDTYGITVQGAYFTNYFNEFFGAYGCLPFDWQEVDGKIVYGGLTDACTEALKTLAQWYKEGLIHPDFIIGTSATGGMVSNILGYQTNNATHFDYSHPNSVPNKITIANPEAELVFGYLPEGPDGQAGMRSWGRACHVVSFGNTDGYGVKVPRLLQIFEEQFTNIEFAQASRLGKKGESWVDLEPGQYGIFKERLTDDYGRLDSGIRTKKGLSEDFNGPSFFAPVAISQEDWLAFSTDEYQAHLAEWKDEKYNLINPFFKVDVVPSAPDYYVDIRTKQMALMNEIILGKKPVESYKAEFEAIWNNGGGDILLEEANDMLDVRKDVYKELGIK